MTYHYDLAMNLLDIKYKSKGKYRKRCFRYKWAAIQRKAVMTGLAKHDRDQMLHICKIYT